MMATRYYDMISLEDAEKLDQKAGVRRHKRRISEKQREAAIDLLSEGVDRAVVADMLGLAYGQVWAITRKPCPSRPLTIRQK